MERRWIRLYVLLGQNSINCVDSVRHLGNYFNTQLSDITDCMMKRSTFIGSVNKLMANFGHLQAHVLCKIFKTFCCNFYGSPIWDINSPGFRKICTTWNVGVRTVLKLPFDTTFIFFRTTFETKPYSTSITSKEYQIFI